MTKTEEALQLAESMPREADRQFWTNIARAWTGLVTCLPKKKSDAWFGLDRRD